MSTTMSAQQFAGRMLGIVNDGALALMISVGHQTKLFDTMSNMPAATSEQIAQAANLNERYVREWLSAMVTGRIVEYDPQAKTFSLPATHAQWLTRSARENNMSLLAQMLQTVAAVEEKVINAFRNGGGVSYADFPHFHRSMADASAPTFDATLIGKALPLAPGLTDRLRSGVSLADVGCGAGHAVNLMAREFPNSRFVGYDFSVDVIRQAREQARVLDLDNVRFEVKDVSRLDIAAQFDVVTAFDAIHDQAKPVQVLSNIHAALRDRGTFFMSDVAGSSALHENMDLPLAPYLYTVSCMHCMTVSLAQNGAGLGTLWGEQQAQQMLAAAGFAEIQKARIDGDILNTYYIATR